jgi:hypothetical protein
MQERLAQTRTYTAMLLRRTEKASEPDARQIIWEHGRRNFALRAAGKLPTVCPIADDSDWAGIGIFDASPEEVTRLCRTTPGSRQAPSPTRCIPCAASAARASPERRVGSSPPGDDR